MCVSCSSGGVSSTETDTLLMRIAPEQRYNALLCGISRHATEQFSNAKHFVVVQYHLNSSLILSDGEVPNSPFGLEPNCLHLSVWP